MSKTRGNVIDPLDVIDRFGTDAFRFTLVALAAQGRDIRMSDDRVEGYRNFMNKLFPGGPLRPDARGRGDAAGTPPGLAVVDRWILSRLQRWSTRSGGGWRSTGSTRRDPPSTSSCGTSSATGTWR